MTDLTILIPALNEAENIAPLISNLDESGKKLGLHVQILVMDGGSQDGTERVATAASEAVEVVRQRAKGYGNALAEGFQLAKGKYILTMDADFSHDPSFLENFWKARDQSEMIIGSRYVPGGQAIMPFARKVLSRALNVFFRHGLSLPWKDLSSGFRLYRSSTIKSVRLQSSEFDVLQEILIRIHAEGWKITEIPIHYKPRRSGKSHAKLIRFGIAYLKTFRRMWKLRNSIESADYDARAHDSIIPLQRYWQRTRKKILEAFSLRDTLALDIGCGSSEIMNSQLNLIGLDILLRKLRYARKFHKPLVNGTIFSLPFPDRTFGCVICSEVIEHIPADVKPFLEMKRVLKAGGTLVLGTPDYGNRTWRIIEALYRIAAPGGYADEHVTHYTLESLSKLLQNLGFTIRNKKYIFHSELILQCTNDSMKPIPSPEVVYDAIYNAGASTL